VTSDGTLAANTLALIRGGRTVVAHLSATLVPGEITAIVGPNGAGKSSLLLALAGLLEPSAGTVTLNGVPLSALAPRQRAQVIGFLPQSPDIAWDVSVESLVALGRLPWRDRGMTDVETALAALDLAALRDRPVSRLSGGERARVLLARVLAGTPRWILADEPLAALDAGAAALVESLVAAHAARGGMVVFTTHQPASIAVSRTVSLDA